jgi:hypothetical protein
MTSTLTNGTLNNNHVVNNDNKYYEEDPTLNLKCIVFTIVLALGYWYAPKKNKWILLGLLYFPYLILAWYDYIYVCQRSMGPTYLSLFYFWGKPHDSQQIKDYERWDPEIRNRVLFVDVLLLVFVLLIITPIMLGE